MGIFSGIKNTYKKSEAAVVVQCLLEHQVHTGLFNFDAAKLATKLVGLVWDYKPDVFNGNFGQRPHKITVAAFALGNGIELFDESDINRNALILSLGNILSEIETNGGLYPLNSLDHELLAVSVSVFVKISNDITETMTADIKKEPLPLSEYPSWQDWFHTFKEEAGKENSQLKSIDNKCIIDFMEHEPLKRAYKDGVDPKSLARDFAAKFDISSFGR